MESWDDENFEPKVVAPAVVVSNKWEGEDEDDDVKESWEDDDGEQKQEETSDVVQVKPKKKSLAEKIAEKERLKREEVERKMKQLEEENISPEEQARRQVESDIKIALETTFGGDSDNIAPSTDDSNPNTKEEFDELEVALSKKLQPLSSNPEYPQFAENLIRTICASMSSFDIKKVKTTIDNLYLEKQKIEKGDKAKKKGKGKAKLKLDNENQYSAYVEVFEDYDDFM